MEKQRQRLLWVVAAGWVVNLAAGLIPALDYEPSEGVNAVFTALITTMFIADKVEKKATEKREEKEE